MSEHYLYGANPEDSPRPDPPELDLFPAISDQMRPGRGLLEQIREVNTAVVPSMYEEKTRRLTREDFDRYYDHMANNVAPKSVVMGEDTLKSLHTQMGDAMFYQMLRRIEVWTTPAGADFIETFWEGYNA